jgi:NADH-quinone oxidoreductase subunit M
MILAWIILLPLVGGALAWIAGRRRPMLGRWISLVSLLVDGLFVVLLWQARSVPVPGQWIREFVVPWIPAWGASIHLAVDGLSLVLVSLTVLLGIVAVACSWTEVKDRVGFYHANLLGTLAGILGVFLALDLFLFYFFWELMLVPMYFLISIWGHEDRVRAAWKFFLFTQAGGLLMLLSVIALYLVHGWSTGTFTFDYPLLLGTNLSFTASFWIMSGFLIAFGVKLPVVPFHTWLPDAHTEAPTAGSVVLAGLLLKTGAYGLFRFVLPLFPDAASAIAPFAMSIAAVGIIYGAVTAFGQTDLKRLVAYTSVSHMGFVLLGIFAGTLAARSGAVMQMVAHGISTGALFLLVGIVQERIHTRDIGRMGGFWSFAPRLGAMGLLFCLASLGLPGFGNFVAEFLVLAGTFSVSAPMTAVAASGLVLSAIYSLWIVQRTFHGTPASAAVFPDLTFRETFLLGVLAVAILWIGIHPVSVTAAVRPVLDLLPIQAAGQASILGAL